jgi:hypothetical protein
MRESEGAREKFTVSRSAPSSPTAPSFPLALPRLVSFWAPLLILALHGAMVIDAARRLSPTWDEIVYPAAGLAQWRTRAITINAEHPCLAKLFDGLPLLALKVPLPFSDPAGEHKDAFRFGYQFTFHNSLPAQRLIFWSRTPAVVFSLMTALLLFIWIRQLWGVGGALVSLVCYTATPILISRASLALLEMPMFFFVLLALYLHDHWVATWRPRFLWTSGAAGGLALACKFSAFPLIGFLVLLELLGCPPVASFAKRLAHISLFLASSALALFLVYVPWQGAWPALCQAFANMALSQKAIPFYWHGRMLLSSPSLLSWLAWCMKAPLMVVALSLWGGTLWWRSQRHIVSWIHLAGFAAACWASALLSKSALATVHLSPMYLALAGMTGGLGVYFSRYRTWEWGVVPALLVLALLDAGHAHPNELAYFNPLAGGTDQGWRWLADSDQDWGQSLPALADYLHAHGDPNVLLAYSGAADPHAYGIRFQDLFSPALYIHEDQGDRIGADPRPVWIALSTKVLQTEPAAVDWLRDHIEAQAMVGSSFFIYDVTRRPDAYRWAGELYAGTNRPALAQWAFERARALGRT